ncbi:MAG: hypothetical protein WD512_11830, partial [Candidatus Paceibacterota bacterium]
LASAVNPLTTAQPITHIIRKVLKDDSNLGLNSSNINLMLIFYNRTIFSIYYVFKRVNFNDYIYGD